MNNKNQYMNKKMPVQFNNWLEERIRNIQKTIGWKISKASAMKILAETNGVEITNDIIKRARLRNDKQ